MDWKIRKHMPSVIVLLIRNSTNFAKVNTSQINQNAVIAKNKHIRENLEISKIDKKKETNYLKKC